MSKKSQNWIEFKAVKTDFIHKAIAIGEEILV